MWHQKIKQAGYRKILGELWEVWRKGFWEECLLHFGKNWETLDLYISFQSEYQSQGGNPQKYITTKVWTIFQHRLKCILSITLVKQVAYLLASETLQPVCLSK